MLERLLKGTRREFFIFATSLTAVVAISSSVYTFTRIDGESESPPASGEGQVTADRLDYTSQDPPPILWQGIEDHVESGGIALAVHAYRIQPSRMTFLYSIDAGEPGRVLHPGLVVIQDEAGYEYEVKDSATIGSALGLTLAVVTTEPYRGGGSVLSLAVESLSDPTGSSSDEALPDHITIEFLRSSIPAPQTDFDTGGRLGPEVAVRAEGLTTGLASLPGGQYIRFLIDRDGEQASLYGFAPDGEGAGVSEEEYIALRASDPGYPPADLDSTLPGWPVPASP